MVKTDTEGDGLGDEVRLYVAAEQVAIQPDGLRPEVGPLLEPSAYGASAQRADLEPGDGINSMVYGSRYLAMAWSL